MVLPNLCQTALGVLRHIEPIIVFEQLGNSLFDTALQLVVRDRCANESYPGESPEQSQQGAMADFFMTYNLINRLVPVVPALLLAKLSDRGWRRAPIAVPLSGYLVSRIVLLTVVFFGQPLQLMYGAAVLFSLSGGYCAFWPGVMTLVSLRSTALDRSKVMMRVELMYGAAGVVGSLVSGHLFLLYTVSLGQGVILLIVSSLLHLLILVLSIFVLQVKQVSTSESEDSHLLSHTDDVDVDGDTGRHPAGFNKVNVVLLFLAAILYDFAVGGAVEILGIFVLKEPLSWTATQVGYGNAAGCSIFLTSYFGVMLFRRWISDVTLILIGMISFATGIYFMSFVTATYMFYLARTLTLFALIPIPTIRSLLSQLVQPSSYGTILTSLQLALMFAGLAYIPAYTRIYQGTLDWFPGFVFMLSSVFTVLAMIPISVIGCTSPHRRCYRGIQGD